MSKFPSVTQVLSLYQDWSNIPFTVLDNAAERGTRVHQICAALVQDLWVPEIPDECRGYIESFKLWMPYIQETLLVEAELIDEDLGFCGHPDWVGKIKGDADYTVLDWKTPLAKGRLWGAQLAAYRHLALKYGGRSTMRIASLRLKKDGSAPILDEYKIDPRDMKAFQSALNAYRYFKEG